MFVFVCVCVLVFVSVLPAFFSHSSFLELFSLFVKEAENRGDEGGRGKEKG